MASINTGRVVLGGLLAGVVMNACDMFWNGVVLKDDMANIAQRLGLDPSAAMSAAVIVPFIVVDFIIGFAVVWNYAAIRPRFGAGPKTALLAIVAPWFVVNAVVWGFAAMGLMPMGAFVRGMLASIVTAGLGSIVGAWVYKEEADQPLVAARAVR